MRKRSSLWLNWLGVALMGYGCGWAWRMGGERGDALPKVESETAATKTATDHDSAMAAAFTAKEDKAVTKVASKASAAVCEAELRKALKGKDIALIGKRATELARLNGVLALRLLLEASPEGLEGQLPAVLHTAASQDPQGVLQLFLKERRLRDLESSLLGGIADRSVEQALAVYADKKALDWSRNALRGIASTWASKDWRAAANYGVSLNDPVERRDFVGLALVDKLLNNFGEAATWLRTLAPATLATLGLEWSVVVPKTQEEVSALLALAPASFFARSSEGPSLALAAVIDATASTEAWLRTLPPGEGRDLAWQTYAVKAAASRPEKLAEILGEMSDPDARNRTTSTMAGLMAFKDPQGAMAFAGSLRDAQARTAARRTVMGVLASNAPALALEMLLADEASWPPEHMGTFGHQLGAYLPAATALAALRMRNPQTRGTWLGSAISAWWKQDRGGVTAWVNMLPPGADHEEALANLARASSAAAPAQAMIWAVELREPVNRSGVIVLVAGAWARTDPAGLNAWLTQTELDAQTRSGVIAAAEAAQQYNGGYSQSVSSNGLTIFSP